MPSISGRGAQAAERSELPIPKFWNLGGRSGLPRSKSFNDTTEASRVILAPGYDQCICLPVIKGHKMDGLSVAASLIAVVQLSAQVFSLCQEYYIGVKHARDEIQRLSNEVLAIHEILENISDLLDGPDTAKFSTLALLDKKNGPAQQCAAQLQEIKTQLDPNEGMRKLGRRALKWPLKSDNVNKMVLALERYKSTFTLALTTDQA